MSAGAGPLALDPDSGAPCPVSGKGDAFRGATRRPSSKRLRTELASQYDGWLWVPKPTPPKIIDQLDREINVGVGDPMISAPLVSAWFFSCGNVGGFSAGCLPTSSSFARLFLHSLLVP